VSTSYRSFHKPDAAQALSSVESAAEPDVAFSAHLTEIGV